MDDNLLVAMCLARAGVDKMFRVVGIPVTSLVTRAVAHGVQFIAFHNEQSAGYAASAYVLLTVSGPGCVHGRFELKKIFGFSLQSRAPVELDLMRRLGVVPDSGVTVAEVGGLNPINGYQLFRRQPAMAVLPNGQRVILFDPGMAVAYRFNQMGMGTRFLRLREISPIVSIVYDY